MIDGRETTTIAGRPPGGLYADVDGIEIVQRLLDAFNRRDAEAILELVDPGAKLVSMIGRLVRDGEPYVGREGLLDYFADAERLWPGLRVEIGQIQAAGDAVVVLGHVRAGTAAGAQRLPAVWTWRLRDGLVTECVVHADERAARKALGIGDYAVVDTPRGHRGGL
jgi:ketosteroid isomerase-like protein